MSIPHKYQVLLVAESWGVCVPGWFKKIAGSCRYEQFESDDVNDVWIQNGMSESLSRSTEINRE